MQKNLPIILLSALVVIGLLVGVGYYFQTYRHGKAPEEGLTVVTAESTTASNKRTFWQRMKEGGSSAVCPGGQGHLGPSGQKQDLFRLEPLPDQGTTQALLYGSDTRRQKRKSWWCDWSVVLTDPTDRNCTPMICMCSPPTSKRTAALNTILWLPTEKAGSGPLPGGEVQRHPVEK